MNPYIKELGDAQDGAKAAAVSVSKAIRRLTPQANGIGSQRLDYLAQALAQLNCAWSLIRASVNYQQTDIVRPHLPVGIKVMPPETPDRDMTRIAKRQADGAMLVASESEHKECKPRRRQRNNVHYLCEQ